VTSPEDNTADRELVSTRVFDAPREVVYRAWVEEESIKRWWGPKGFTNVFTEFDPVPGGRWKFVMRGPDGRDYDNEIRFIVLNPPKRIVLDHVSPPRFRITADFEEWPGNKTRLVWKAVFESAAVFRGLKDIATRGNIENLDRLETVLASSRKFLVD
jgi:uncharacterized protein YndB with AHSA1/START domain